MALLAKAQKPWERWMPTWQVQDSLGSLMLAASPALASVPAPTWQVQERVAPALPSVPLARELVPLAKAPLVEALVYLQQQQGHSMSPL